MRWGTALHDRWLLPHFVAADIRDVVARSRRAPATRSSRRGSSPFVEFRFPRYGTVDLRRRHDRAAPGDRAVARAGRGGERQRHGALRRLVGRAPAGEGHRHDRRPPRGHLQRPRAAARPRPACRASSSPACASARGARRRRCIRRSACRRRSTFDLVDTWAQRALGGCTYHVAHPGRPQLRHVPGQRQRSRGAPLRALLGARPHAGPDARASREPPNPATPTTLDLRWHRAWAAHDLTLRSGVRRSAPASPRARPASCTSAAPAPRCSPWAYARHHGGTFILRIEDTDVERSTPEAVQAILDAMAWLGLDYDEGPYYQMQRMDRYRAVIADMLARGLAYRAT